MNDLVYKSTDMGTVAFLRYKGYEPQQCLRSDGQVTWFFHSSDGLFDSLDDYNDGEAVVDPKKYNALFAAVKRQMHQA